MGPGARERKIDFDYLEQRGSCHVNLVEDLGKRSKSLDQLLRGQQGRIRYSACGKMHKGVFRFKALVGVSLGLFPCLRLDCTFKKNDMPSLYIADCPVFECQLGMVGLGSRVCTREL